MRGKKSIYSLNKENPKGIVYPHANGESTVLTPESFANEEEFYRWKEISDSIFREERLADHIYENHTSPLTVGTVRRRSAEEALIEKEERKEQSVEIEKELSRIRLALTETQLRRWIKYRCDGKTERQIAKEEGVNQSSVHRSLAATKKFLSNWKKV